MINLNTDGKVAMIKDQACKDRKINRTLFIM